MSPRRPTGQENVCTATIRSHVFFVRTAVRTAVLTTVATVAEEERRDSVDRRGWLGAVEEKEQQEQEGEQQQRRSSSRKCRRSRRSRRSSRARRSSRSEEVLHGRTKLS